MRTFIIFIIFMTGSNMRKLVGNGLAGKGRPRPGAACGSLLMVLGVEESYIVTVRSNFQQL